MNEKNLKQTEQIIGKTYMEISSDSLASSSNKIKNLLAQRRLPDTPWTSMEIDLFLNQCAMMDSNNYENRIAVGEREARIYSQKVKDRNLNFGHGIGRSGDIDTIQPKAPGASLVAKLTNSLVKDSLELAGYQFIKGVLVLPLATGMALTLCLLHLRSVKPDAKYVIWPRIDQKTCLKCITTAGFKPIVIEGIVSGCSITTNEELIKQKILEYGKENILCVLSTTSCFAPREPDNVEAIAKICKENGINHVINNAYGVQCSKISNMINQAIKNGTVDLVVQSTDKNYLVPVGGSVVFTPEKATMKSQNSLYPGRASNSPILDLFITFVEMGKLGWLNLLKERKNNYQEFTEVLKEFCIEYGEESIIPKGNKISMAMTVKGFHDKNTNIDDKDYNKLGAIMFKKRVTGARVISEGKKTVCGIDFKNYGSSNDNYPFMPYITMAASIGGTLKELKDFLEKLKPFLTKNTKQVLQDNEKNEKTLEESINKDVKE